MTFPNKLLIIMVQGDRLVLDMYEGGHHFLCSESIEINGSFNFFPVFVQILFQIIND